ncbi:MAG: hypothetical protein P1U63_04915 [Coxiellaceae bacterium]|nr:hypothetical protein [Coxiellaceae bacterium]
MSRGSSSNSDRSDSRSPSSSLSPSRSVGVESWHRTGRIAGWGGEPEPKIIREQKAESAAEEFSFASIGTVWALTTVAVDIYRITKDPKAELKNILFTAGLLVRLAIGYYGAKDTLKLFYALSHPYSPDPSRVPIDVILRKTVHDVLDKLMAMLRYGFSGGPFAATTPAESQLASNKAAVAETLKGFAPAMALFVNIMLASIKTRVAPSSSQAFSEFKILFPLMMVPTLGLHLKMMTIKVDDVIKDDVREESTPVSPSTSI